MNCSVDLYSVFYSKNNFNTNIKLKTKYASQKNPFKYCCYPYFYLLKPHLKLQNPVAMHSEPEFVLSIPSFQLKNIFVKNKNFRVKLDSKIKMCQVSLSKIKKKLFSKIGKIQH